jgi:hypothetical protein
MSNNLPTALIRLTTCTAILLGLLACERDSYTSWNCSLENGSKIMMVLRKAQMELKDEKLAYCGSLGNQSYFDQQCPSQIDQSTAVFTPSTGALSIKGQIFQCIAL